MSTPCSTAGGSAVGSSRLLRRRVGAHTQAGCDEDGDNCSSDPAHSSARTIHGEWSRNENSRAAIWRKLGRTQSSGTMRIESIGLALERIMFVASSTNSSSCLASKPSQPGRNSKSVSTHRIMRRCDPSNCHSCQHRNTCRSQVGGSASPRSWVMRPPSNWPELSRSSEAKGLGGIQSSSTGRGYHSARSY